MSDITFGSEYVFASPSRGVDKLSVASLDSTYFVVGYDSDVGSFSPNLKGKAIIGSVSDSTISYGTEVEITSAGCDDVDVAALDSTHFVYVYVADDSGYGHCVVCSVSGTSITVGTDYTFNSASTSHLSVASLDSTHFVITYQDGGNSNYGTAIIGTVSGTSITFGSEYVFNSATTYYTDVVSLDSTHFVVGYEDNGNSNYGTAIIGTISGSTITYGSEYVFNSATTTYISVTELDSSKFVVTFTDGTDYLDYGRAIVGSVSGSTITYGSKYTFNSGVTYGNSVSSFDSSSFVVAYYDADNSNYGTTVSGEVSGSTITFGSEYVFNSDTTYIPSVSALTPSKFVVSYQDGGNSNYGTAIIGTTSSPDVTVSPSADNVVINNPDVTIYSVAYVNVTITVDAVSVNNPDTVVSSGTGVTITPNVDQIDVGNPDVSIIAHANVSLSVDNISIGNPSVTIIEGVGVIATDSVNSLSFTNPDATAKDIQNISVQTQGLNFTVPDITILVEQNWLEITKPQTTWRTT